MRRLGNGLGSVFWEMCNSLFDLLPLAARVEKKILVLHGGLGATLNSLGKDGKATRHEWLCFVPHHFFVYVRFMNKHRPITELDKTNHEWSIK